MANALIERTQGIFRLSGATSEIQEYTDVLDEGMRVVFEANELICLGLDLELPATADINAVAGLLKLFFRELPEPVLQMELYPEFVAAVDGITPSPLDLICLRHRRSIRYRIETRASKLLSRKISLLFLA